MCLHRLVLHFLRFFSIWFDLYKNYARKLELINKRQKGNFKSKLFCITWGEKRLGTLRSGIVRLENFTRKNCVWIGEEFISGQSRKWLNCIRTSFSLTNPLGWISSVMARLGRLRKPKRNTKLENQKLRNETKTVPTLLRFQQVLLESETATRIARDEKFSQIT